MEVITVGFRGMDLGVYSGLRNVGQSVPEVMEVFRHSATIGPYLWIFFLAILVWRWWAICGAFPLGDLIKVLLFIGAVEVLGILIDRPRPDDAQDFFGQIVGRSYPNGPTFRAVLISALMWETSSPGW